MADEQAAVVESAPTETQEAAVVAAESATATEQETKTETSEKPVETPAPEAAKESELGEKGKAELIKLRKRAQEAEKQAAYERGQREALERIAAAKAETHPAVDAFPVPRPIQGPEEAYDDFVIRLQDWVLDKRQFHQGIADKKAAEVKTIQTTREKASAQIAAGQAKYPDFQEVVSEVVMPNSIITEILDSEIGHDLAYHLAQNPVELDRISALPQNKQIKEIARLEDKIRAGAVTKPKSEAPEPPPVVRASTVQNDEQRYMSDDISPAERIRLSQ
ncbi:MAG TPA: hypothetical protein VIY48_20035, partial [Candidatus Paceibacterota bacterium]